MSSIIPYLYFDGQCEEAFRFYHSVLGGTIPYIGRYSDMPPASDGSDEKTNTVQDLNRIMHISLQTHDGSMILGSDIPDKPIPGYEFRHGNNISMSLNAKSREQAKAMFDGLSQGGVITMPLDDTFWGAYFGMWVDKFGVSWMVNFDEPQQNPE